MGGEASVTIRLYKLSTDRSRVLSFCEGIYGGFDYLPGRLDALCSDGLSTCVVLTESSGEVVAFANFRCLRPAAPGCEIFLDCAVYALFH